MNLYFKNSSIGRKATKLNYLSASVFRSVYLIQTSVIHHSTEKKIFSRGSCIPKTYVSHEVVIHKGNKLISKNVSPWLIGFKFGEFT